ncbi:MAG: class I SAM-dependent methyltransferase [Thermoplasmataceae archaeon]
MKKKDAQSFMASISGKNVLDNNYRIMHDGDYVYFPLIEGAEINDETVSMAPEENSRKPSPKGHSGAFDVIGDIAIIRERKDGNTQKIVEFIADTIKHIRTIYLDHGVTGEFRLRNLEFLHGDDNPETIHRENGISLWLNVKKAYFSPRLATERMIISSRVRENEKILDMFSGVGSFTITIMKNRNVNVVALDINPEAIKALEKNYIINKIKGNLSAKVCDSWSEIKNIRGMDRIIMNNPTSRKIDYDSIRNALKKNGLVNFYEINNIEGIAERMSAFTNEGFMPVDKRIVHGYSKTSSMVAMEFRRVEE